MKNLSTRKLKRAHIRAVKTVWRWEQVMAEGLGGRASNRADLERARGIAARIAEELRRRGWSA